MTYDATTTATSRVARPGLSGNSGTPPGFEDVVCAGLDDELRVVDVRVVDDAAVDVVETIVVVDDVELTDELRVPTATGVPASEETGTVPQAFAPTVTFRSEAGVQTPPE